MKKEILIPLAVAGLAVAFVAVCAVVVLSRGGPRSVRAKLKIGALLLALTASPAAGGCGMWETTCYAAGPDPNRITVEDPDPQTVLIEVDLSVTNIIAGTISEVRGEAFSFRVHDWDVTKELQRGEILAADGAFDEGQDEAFEIALDPSLPAGQYRLLFFTTDAQSQPQNHGYMRGLMVTR